MMLIMALSMSVPLISQLLSKEGSGPRPMGVTQLKEINDMYKIVLRPTSPKLRGTPNDPTVVWAVYFFKPYCGACRRIRPIVEALASTVNHTEHLRFAAIDCVKFRVLCTREGVETYPRIRLYKADLQNAPKGKELSEINMVRKFVTEWQGMLIAYEVVAWIKSAQAQGHISKAVNWPEDDALATAMLKYKERGEVQVDGVTTILPKDPAGFIKDIQNSMYMSLLDAVFKGDGSLTGARLASLLKWVQMLAATYPSAEMRARSTLTHCLEDHLRPLPPVALGPLNLPSELSALTPPLQLRFPFPSLQGPDQCWRGGGQPGGGEQADRSAHPLAGETRWKQDKYEAALREWGALEIDETTEWGWCQPGAPGVGGYPCGLWLLFHTCIANADKYSAGAHLKTIHTWVKKFFGCSECASHFDQMWEAQDGANQRSHPDAALWLWRAHNMVNERLLKDPDNTGKEQWPSLPVCESCYKQEARNGSAGIAISSTAFKPAQWEQGNVFVFIQETLCYGSDTLTCAQFYDPSMDGSASSGLWWLIAILVILIVLVGLCCLLLLMGAEEEPPSTATAADADAAGAADESTDAGSEAPTAEEKKGQ
ncbi:hypothetical protein CYMTET_39669 [Cymbomonas tetramitiformis]|uniref:Sulfhydryl oxidase n=1 Tax=Cymbomonas tetramitiformis TaxID=36881 RepID=A0AAE0CBV2_9CHLO|nr:hypothetical protein CYMTET_39669 [Cymbomonas tetramitiformis]